MANKRRMYSEMEEEYYGQSLAEHLPRVYKPDVKYDAYEQVVEEEPEESLFPPEDEGIKAK